MFLSPSSPSSTPSSSFFIQVEARLELKWNDTRLYGSVRKGPDATPIDPESVWVPKIEQFGTFGLSVQPAACAGAVRASMATAAMAARMVFMVFSGCVVTKQIEYRAISAKVEQGFCG